MRYERRAKSVVENRGEEYLKDISGLINKYGIIGVAAGSLFVFKGILRAVLINYPNREEKDALIR